MDNKVRYELEFPIHSSPQLLYQYISTPSGLQEWFADNVNSRGEFFTFKWDDSEEKARLHSKKTGEKIPTKMVKVLGHTVKEGSKQHSILVERKKHFDRLAEKESGV